MEQRDSRFRPPKNLDVEMSSINANPVFSSESPDPSTTRHRCLTEWASGLSDGANEIEAPLKAALAGETRSSWRGMSSQPVTRRLGDGIPGNPELFVQDPSPCSMHPPESHNLPLSESPMCFCSSEVSRKGEHEELHLKRFGTSDGRASESLLLSTRRAKSFSLNTARLLPVGFGTRYVTIRN